MTWHDRFDRLLKAMASGEPHRSGTGNSRRNEPKRGASASDGEKKA